MNHARHPLPVHPDQILDELAAYLRPPGQGIHAFSTGKEAIDAATAAYLGDAWNPSDSWRGHLSTLATTPPPIALLAIPCDTGAGIVRGAAWGPAAIREGLGAAPVFDLGDVFCIPHLLDDEMCSEAQLTRSRASVYADVPAAQRATMPVSALSIATRVYKLLARLCPSTKIMLLGGDHSVTWPAMDALLAEDPADNADVGIVHFDAHTDLLPERLGVPYCFATWAYHANERLGRGERLLQLGIRASGRERGHWEPSLGVRQIWADEARAMSPEALAETVVTHLRDRGLHRIYVSNDLDGTDMHWAAACGTPEPDGLTPAHVEAVLGALEGKFQLMGADLVELAPGLSLDPKSAARSVETAVRYTRSSLDLLAAVLE
jgi:agmatinase